MSTQLLGRSLSQNDRPTEELARRLAFDPLHHADSVVQGVFSWTDRMATYFEKLRDPRWQRKRLQIMERDEWACQICGAEDDELNVHHGYYANNRDPWDYENESLWTLCRPCHERVSESLTDLKRALGFIEVGAVEVVADVFCTLATSQIERLGMSAIHMACDAFRHSLERSARWMAETEE